MLKIALWRCCVWSLLTTAAVATRVAIVGGGVGGTAAAYFLLKDNPDWHIELFEREECVGGRTTEVTMDGKVLELGASIIHGANEYMLSLAEEMGLTLDSGDDTGAAFNIWDGKDFVFSQTGSTLTDFWAVAKRYGVTPLRYKWLSEEAGRKFGGIYKLQQQGVAFTTPEAWLTQLDIYNVTQQRAADYMTDHLTKGMWRYGAGLFIEELAGAINRINYNQHNEQLNALAGLVSYLPAAKPQVYSIKEGNAALPRKLAAAAKLQALHLQTSVQSITIDSSGMFTLSVQPTAATVAAKQPAAKPEAAAADPYHPADHSSSSSSSSGHQHLQQQQQQPSEEQHKQQQQQEVTKQVQEYGPYDAVILATPLEGSGLDLKGLDPEPQLPPRSYQQTTTSFVTGYLDASFFDRADLEPGDIFVTDRARTPFTVVASKGTVSVTAVPQVVDTSDICGRWEGSRSTPRQAQHQQQQQQDERTSAAAASEQGREPGSHQQQPQKSEQVGQQQQDPEQIPLWKVFSDEPLTWHDLRTLFVNGTVVASKSWAAYPKFQAPEKFAPFLLGPGLCYNNALENAASAMEVAAVAAKNCALLVQQHAKAAAAAQDDVHAEQAAGSPGVAVE